MMDKKLNKNGNKRGMSPNSQKNLGKGRLGNNHANKDYSITRIIKEMLDLPADAVLPGANGVKTWRQLIARAILYSAVKGEVAMIKELLDRLEGKVTQPIGGEGGGPIKTEIIVSSDATKKLLGEIVKGTAPHAPHND